MQDYDDPKFLSQLHASAEASAQKLRPHREDVASAKRQMAGKHFGEDGAPDNVPVNMIDLGVNIFKRGVASHNPHASVTSDYDELLPEATNMELALNQQAERVNIKGSFESCSIEALFKLGVMEVGVTSRNTPPDGEGHLHDPGNVFADTVLFEDLLLDMTAKCWEQMQFIGHEYPVPFEWLKDNEQFEKKGRDAVTGPDDNRNRDSESITPFSQNGEDSFRSMVTLRQYYIPRDNLRVIVAKNSPTKCLFKEAWGGPENGPYIPLRFGNIPGHVIPNAPVPMWVDLHDMCNRSFNKAWRQADRQKTFTAVPPQGQADGYTVVDIVDGEVRTFNEPDKIKEISTGGANPANIAISTLAKNLLVYVAGNWDALGGLAAMSRTASQDEMLSEGASGRLKDMQQIMVSFMVEVYRHMAYWVYTDHLSEYHLRKPVRGTNRYVETIWTPEQRSGDFFQRNFKISTYSDGNRSPMEQGFALREFLRDDVMPAMPYMQQAGIGVNWEYVFKELSDLLRIPEGRRMLMFLNGEQIPKAEPGGGMPAQTERKYVRESRSGATRRGFDQVLTNNLLSPGSTDANKWESMSKAMG